jgi:putative membrane protein
LNTDRSLTLHHFIRGFLLLGFAFFIVYLVKADNLLYYIAPIMTTYVKLSAVALYIIAVYQLYLGFMSLFGKSQSCDCGHISPSWWKNGIAYSLFIFPLLLGFLLPDTALGSAMAAKKGINLNSSAQIKTELLSRENNKSLIITDDTLPNQNSSIPNAVSEELKTDQTENNSSTTDESLDELFPYDSFTEYYAKFAKRLYPQDIIPIEEELFMETITTLDLYLDEFSGKKVKISGFVFRQDDMSSDQFAVSRFAMSCCSADAAPYGIFSEYPNAQKYADDTWVEVIGTIEKTNFNDFEIMKLRIEQISTIPQPENTYVYPNYDFEP